MIRHQDHPYSRSPYRSHYKDSKPTTTPDERDKDSRPHPPKKSKITVVLLNYQEQRKDYQVSPIYTMFQNSGFRVSTLMHVYYNKLKENGPHQYLTNKLYEVKYEDLEFYIPQLCYLLIKNDSPYLEKFLSSLCMRSIALYELINWCFVSFSDKDRQDKTRAERMARIDKVFETAMTNADHNDVLVRNKLKSYQQSVWLYLNNLIQMSLILKTFKAEDRKPRLKNFITRANVALEKYRHRTQEFQFCQGISLPFTSSRINGKPVHSNLVVRLIEGECTCFNTKKRVPYRIVVETIDPAELQIKQPIKKAFGGLQSNPSQTSLRSKENLDEDVAIEDFLHNDITIPDKQELDKRMAEIVKNKKNRKHYGDLRKIDIDQDETPRGVGLLKKYINQIHVVTIMQGGHSEREIAQTEQEIKIKQEQQEQIRQTVNRKRSFKDKVEEEKYETNLKRFKISFPEVATERTRSCMPRLNDTNFQCRQRKGIAFWLQRFKENSANNHRYKHRTIKSLTNYKRVQFFKQLIKDYPYQESILRKIYVQLQLDLYEKKLEKQRTFNRNNNQDMQQDFDFPRKFGPWDELWEDKAEVIKRNSPYQHFESYQLKPIIVKGGDDLRQELMTMQIIRKMNQAFEDKGLSLSVKAYEIIVVSSSSGLLEFCADTISIDGLKKKYPACKSLVQIYKEIFQQDYEEAQKNFIQSLAAYSIISYILQIKDRHNGNILIDSCGRIIHIDFGFILCTSPGNVNFEKAPFKLTQEYADLMNGVGSDLFTYFKSLLFQGFTALRTVVEDIMLIIEIMMQDSDFPCFEKFDQKLFRERFQEHADDERLASYINKLIDQSLNNWRTIQYDNFQRMTNGIMP